MAIHSYSQPSQSDDLFDNSEDSAEYNETEDLIRRDQAELDLEREHMIQYPPQPEVEFGFPSVCYCGAQPQIETCTRASDLGRRYYTCVNREDGECHVWKWWDEALMEEMGARDRHVLQLSEKVDNLALLSDFETEQKLLRLEKKVSDFATEKPGFSLPFELVLGAVLFVLVLIGVGIMFV